MTDTGDSQAGEALDSQIQSLCQELQDMIFKFVQDSQLASQILITSNYKPPTALRISRDTRARFAKAYYGRGYLEFVFDTSSVFSPFLHWLDNVDYMHFEMMRDLEITVHGVPWDSQLPTDLEQEWARKIHRLWIDAFERNAERKLEDLSLVVAHANRDGADKRRFKNGVPLEKPAHKDGVSQNVS